MIRYRLREWYAVRMDRLVTVIIKGMDSGDGSSVPSLEKWWAAVKTGKTIGRHAATQTFDTEEQVRQMLHNAGLRESISDGDFYEVSRSQLKQIGIDPRSLE